MLSNTKPTTKSITTYLSGVTIESRCPALGQTTHTLFGYGDLESMEQILIFSLIDLQTALDQIQGHNKGMSGTTGQNTTNTAQGKVFHGTEFAGVTTVGCSGSLNLTANDRAVTLGWCVTLHPGERCA